MHSRLYVWMDKFPSVGMKQHEWMTELMKERETYITNARECTNQVQDGWLTEETKEASEWMK